MGHFNFFLSEFLLSILYNLVHCLQVSSDSFITVSEADEEGIEAPKVLGDVFESVAGAVFLDSGMDLIATWRVYYSMMKPYIGKLEFLTRAEFQNTTSCVHCLNVQDLLQNWRVLISIH